MPAITPFQVRLGRAAVGLGIRDLAAAADVSPSTVQRYEGGKGGLHVSSLDKLQRALEERGVIFIPADSAGGPGVRLKS